MIFEMTLDQVGLCKDVIIDEQHEIAGSLPNSHIARCRRSGLGLVECPQIRIGGGLLVQNALSVVRRVVVDDENFVAITADGLLLDPVNRASPACQHDSTSE